MSDFAILDGGIQHNHTWRYNIFINAMICRCGDRIDCDHRLPGAIEAGYELTDRTIHEEESRTC